ncbi:MAG: TIGR01459 family HAD-type hydrolase [Hyphomicrobiales bacterium]
MEDAVLARPEIEIINGLSALAHDIDVVLCDIWGVLHNGVKGYEAASHALTRFRQGGGRVILVSNAPRPNIDIVPILDRFGISRSAWDGIVTSGDIARDILVRSNWKKFFWLGPERDQSLFDRLPLDTSPLEQADVIVCTGLFNDITETPETYREMLETALALNKVMLCANPDLVVERGGELIYCAGAIAALYEQMGGRTCYSGKPHVDIYQAAVSVVASLNGKNTDRSRILLIGDAIRTDIAGAVAFGCPSLFVLRGIHMHELGLSESAFDNGTFMKFMADAAFRPRFAIDSLSW